MATKTRNQTAAATLHGQSITDLLDAPSLSTQPRVGKQLFEEVDTKPIGLEDDRGLLMKCPSCGKRMELDPGFAGSVCRCSHCLALITVPKDFLGPTQVGNASGQRPVCPPTQGKGKVPIPPPSTRLQEPESPWDEKLHIPLPEPTASSESRAQADPSRMDTFAAFAAENQLMSQERRAVSVLAAPWGIFMAIAGGTGLLAVLLVALLI